MQLFYTQLVTSATMNTNITTAAYNVQQMNGFAIQATFTGTPTGTFYLQGSCDPVYKSTYVETTGGAVVSSVVPSSLNTTVTNWSTIANSTTVVSAAGNVMWNVSPNMYNWVQMVYTDGSSGMSTAVLNVQINAKGA